MKTKKEIEQNILKAAHELPYDNEYGYRFVGALGAIILEELDLGQAWDMALTTAGWIGDTRKQEEIEDKLQKVVHGMEKAGIIKVSKSGYMWKFTD